MQPLPLAAPPPRFDSEVLELMGDSEHAIRERYREIDREIECKRQHAIREKRLEILRQRQEATLMEEFMKSWDKLYSMGSSKQRRRSKALEANMQ